MHLQIQTPGSFSILYVSCMSDFMESCPFRSKMMKFLSKGLGAAWLNLSKAVYGTERCLGETVVFVSQRGIDLVSLDVSYFTSLSYYILLLFGMRGLFSLFFREDTIDDTDMVRRQMNPMGGMGPAFDVQKAFDAEKDALELVSLYVLPWYLCMAILLSISLSLQKIEMNPNPEEYTLDCFQSILVY